MPNDYLSMRYDEWLDAEHKGMRMQMSRKAFTARIVELACSDGEWTQSKDASGSVLKTSCEKWCPGLTAYCKRAAGFGGAGGWVPFLGRRRGIFRTVVLDYCTAHGTFSSGTVQRMITNPVYIGKIAYGRRRTETIEGTRGETHVVKSDGYEMHDGQHDAIIDDATWAAAQALVGTRKPNMKTHDDGHVNMLNGLLVCPVCGRKMSSKPNRGKLKKDGTRGKTTWAYYCPHTSKARGASCTFKSQYPQECVDAEVVQLVSLASRSDAFVDALRRRIDDATDIEQLKDDIERIEGEKAANDKRMRMLMMQIDSLDPADRSYERKFNDLQRRLDDLYDRDAGLSDALEEAQAKMTTAEKRMDGERRLLEELDRIPELLEGADEQTRFDLIHEAVSEVHILTDKNPRKERVVANVTFKCPVRFFWEEIPGVAEGYTPMTPDSLGENNFRDDEAHVETVCLLSKLG